MASHLGNYNAQSALSYAGGVFLLCEFLDTSAFERRWIWRTSRKRKPFNAIKLVFLLAKYSGIITQLLSIAVITRVYDVDGPTISGCSTWIWLHFGAQYVLWTCLEVLLMLRIYALYGQSKFMGAFLILFMMAEMAVAGYFIIGHVVIEAGPALPIPPYFFAIEEGYCIHNVALGLPIQVMYLGFIQLTTHILILALTLARCVPALRVHHTLKRLLHQLIVDGLIGFIVVVGACGSPGNSRPLLSYICLQP
ncbi:hypothetical protein BD626DRAFT_475795 [Schizophyllum amplum]|uniref:Uncharacterized protein n=1 Tax=Schizophyllum amplum TaxID=97359 RepID=A0A550CYS8_9AGAR|nr:hypothetical protein BD626DRAFT_475795 [Auriculariopsis ampla]